MSDDKVIWYLKKMKNSYKIKISKAGYKYVEFGGSDKKVYCNKRMPFVKATKNAIEYFEYFIFGCGTGTGNGSSDGVFWGKRVCLKKVIDKYRMDDIDDIEASSIDIFSSRSGFSLEEAKSPANQKEYGYYYFKKKEIKELEKRIKMDLGIESLKDRLMELIDNGIKQIICHGAPGTGKTYTITKVLMEGDKFGKIQGGERINFVQFHPSYDYTDFVEGLRPVQTKTETETKTETTFVRVDGIFKRFCREVVKANNDQNNKDQNNKDQKYAFVIDEINRADLSKVFGELMYCLEEGYRGEKNRITTQYSNLPTYKIVGGYAEIIENDVFKEGFYIPDNVVIIGMMNDIDRSVESFDFAMQRRFHWINVDADIEAGPNDMWENMFRGIEYKGDLEDDEKTRLIETIKTRMSELNKTIVGKDDKNGKKQKLGEEYKIGHAYFKNFVKYYCDARKQDPKVVLDEDAFNIAVDKIWKYAIEPVIKSYIRGKRNMDGFLEKCENSLKKGNTDEQSNEQ